MAPDAPARRPRPRPSTARLALGVLGVVGIGYGAFRILEQPERSHPTALLVWLAVAVAVHDGVLVPATFAVGAVLTAVVPPRARRYVQGALVASALVTAVALPLVYRRGSAAPVKALEDQDYAAHLALLVGLIAAGSACAWALSVLRDRRRRGPAVGGGAPHDPGGTPGDRSGEQHRPD